MGSQQQLKHWLDERKEQPGLLHVPFSDDPEHCICHCGIRIIAPSYLTPNSMWILHHWMLTCIPKDLTSRYVNHAEIITTDEEMKLWR
jgi:hypothetical protein